MELKQLAESNTIFLKRTVIIPCKECDGRGGYASASRNIHALTIEYPHPCAACRGTGRIELSDEEAIELGHLTPPQSKE